MGHRIWPPNAQLSKFIMDQFPDGYRGWGVDVGASDGVSVNTTFVMEVNHRWTILSVEANPYYKFALKTVRARVEMCACSDKPAESATFHIYDNNPESFSSLKPSPRPDLYPDDNGSWSKVEVPVHTVDELLEKWEFPKLDLLCVDTEGTELDVLRGCDLARLKPKVIVTECWDRVGPIDPYLENLGYKKTARSAHNDIFILKEGE